MEGEIAASGGFFVTKTSASQNRDDSFHGGSMFRIAVIGFGYWGPNLVRNWNQNPRAELKAVCDIDESRLALARSQYHYLETVRDYHDLLKNPEIDAVNIATPISTHYQIARDALLAGKHVLVEKPLTAASEETLDLIDIAARKNLILMVGHTFLYSPPVLKIGEYIREGTLGSIDFVQMTRINLGRLKHDYNVIWDLAPHDFAILDYWLGQEPEAVQTTGKAARFRQVCDIAFINLQYPDGVLANIHLSWLSPVKLRQTYLVGDKKMVVYDDAHPTDKIRLLDQGIDIVQDPRDFGEFQLTYRTGDVYLPHLANIEPLAAECAHFMECVETGKQPRTHGEHGLHIVRLIEASLRSLEQGGAWVPLKR
jgi:predicted dehydrogenase